MARRTSRLSASATPIFGDVPIHTIPDKGASLDAYEQLLTPSNSRSETSSNNENALVEEKPVTRRRSARITSASLQAAETLRAVSDSKKEPSASSSPAYVDSLAKVKRTRSSLRHSIAVMESSLQGSTAMLASDSSDSQHAVASDTPLSTSSQDLKMTNLSTPHQQWDLRKIVEKALAKDEPLEKLETMAEMSCPHQPPRRSKRLSVVEKATDLLDRASSVLGKRPRGFGKAKDDLGRRASLRPRDVKMPENKTVPPVDERPLKKRRASESEVVTLQSDNFPSEEPTIPPRPRYKPKVWLTHGLYTGQEPSDLPPKQRKSKNSSKTSTGPMQRRILPMPMFAGARLVRNGRDYQLPFDIFSPLPPGQPKPDEWRKTNKNVFVGDAASEWKANKKLELSTCMCTEDTGCDENCQNRYMFYECDNGNCRLGPECGNRNFNELKQRTKAGGKYNIGVEVIKTADRGYGVRSNRTFEPNQIIVEYTGEIINQWECEKRMRTIYKNNECYYLMYFDQNMIIDATRGSIARFVNHSCEPNCRMEKWTVAGKPRMALFAGDRGIMTGEELSYDYNFDPYSNKNVQQCRCGSENCRGILGPRPKDKDQRTKIEPVGSGTGKSKATSMKRKCVDAPHAASLHQDKKRKLLNKGSIKAGVQKAVLKASTTRAKMLNTKTPASSTGRGKAQAEAPVKRNIKLPTVKAASRVKAAVKVPRQRTNFTGAASSSSANKTIQSKSQPPSNTKRSLSATVKASVANTSKSTISSRKPHTKSPVKSRRPAAEKKTVAETSGSSKARSLSSSVRTATRGVVSKMKGMRK